MVNHERNRTRQTHFRANLIRLKKVIIKSRDKIIIRYIEKVTLSYLKKIEINVADDSVKIEDNNIKIGLGSAPASDLFSYLYRMT